jgi:HD-GYP domain-containing protein (c-di-GMP phosphodiesterase class II)
MNIEEKLQNEFQLSDNRQVNNLLNDVVGLLKDYTEDQLKHINQLAKIGVALSATRNLDHLLEMIVDEARAFTNADGGTLYLVSDDGAGLRFSIIQNDTLKTRMGGVTGSPINWPDVPLRIEDKPNNANVSAYAANSGQIVEIPDVYEAPGFNFEGTRKFDAGNNYRSKSMLVIPMRDHENEIIGVLQLINARDEETGETIPFAHEFRELTAALASQAAIAITNARLIRDIQALFDSFIQAIASAIDEKSPYTGGHISRVANLTMEIAKKINATTEGPFGSKCFTEDEMYELRLAAWLHDTGKITTPEHVVDKHTKLETIFDRMELVRMRFELAKAQATIKTLTEQMASNAAGSDGGGNGHLELPPEAIAEIERLNDEYSFVSGCNATQEFVPDATIERLDAIASETVQTANGSEPILSPDELYNMHIRKGNLTTEERKIIENHATMTIKILNKLPFPKKIKNVPYIAGAHHEKLSGRGYPLGLKGDQINLQARIMALADIFEALTARDRPYKQPKKLSECIKILGFMMKDLELDTDVVQFFLDNKMHIEYAREHLSPEQIDVE